MSAGQSGCRAWKRRVCNGPTTPGSRMAHARRRPWTRGHGDQLVQESLSLISLPKCRGDGTASRVRPLRKSRSSLLLPHAAASCVTNMISSPHQEGWTGGYEETGELVRPAPGTGHRSGLLEVSSKVPSRREYMNETDKEDRYKQSRFFRVCRGMPCHWT